jgi:regulatory protein
MANQQPGDVQDLRDGVVSRVEAQRKDRDRVSVFIDGEFAFGLSVDVALRAGLRKGLPLSVHDQRALLADDARVRARLAALDLIAHRARTEAEVRRALARKGFPEDAALAAVDRLLELGYLDDDAYARAFVRGRAASRGHGPGRLRADLLRRGVSPATIDAALDDLLDADGLLESATHHARKRWARLASEEDHLRRRKKLTDFLVRRGYDFDVIRTVTETLEREG